MVIALIDGDHHPPAVRAALDRLDADRGVAAVVFCGGGEKAGAEVLARAEDHYGRPVLSGMPAAEALAAAAASVRADTVVDLADEPVLDAQERLDIAALALHLGLRYEAPGMSLTPPPAQPAGAPALAVIATAKRSGKTAVAGHWARLLSAAGMRPAIVCMGRGGPDPPAPAAPRAGLAELLAIARAGGHAASDHLEGAVLAGVQTVGCRRVGGGLGGEPFACNVAEGARLAAGMGASPLILEGSGAAIPPLAARRTVCIVAGPLAGLDRVRLLRADLVLLAGDAPDPGGWPALRLTLEPEPAEPVPAGARVAHFSTGAPPPAGVDPVVSSPDLGRRDTLAAAAKRAVAERCDVWLTELKGAAVDVVAERAIAADARVIFIRNRPRAGDGDLDAALMELAGG